MMDRYLCNQIVVQYSADASNRAVTVRVDTTPTTFSRRSRCQWKKRMLNILPLGVIQLEFPVLE